MTEPVERPDPDHLLERIEAAEERASRGRLKVWLGFAPGVGKTYAMLENARELHAEGADVTVGWVDTHGRYDTAALLLGLEILPRRRVLHRGHTFEELDLDAALARGPGVLLLDELAHTNAPGSRHARRWQDALELLDAGIEVHTTLNIQHVESLNDVVAQITGVRVRETVPDDVLDRADEIVLVDLAPEELLERLREGKVYLGEQKERAAQGFFRQGNLLALRELALRRAAERVDADVRAWRAEHRVETTWPVGERILVCVGPSPASARLVRAGRRMAASQRAPWFAAWVERPGTTPLPRADRDRLEAHLRLAESLGATVVRLEGARPAEAILAWAREQNVTRIVIGKPTHARWRDRLRGSLLDDVVRGSGEIEVHAIAGESEAGTAAQAPEPPARPAAWPEYAAAALLVALATGAAHVAWRAVALPDVAMLYLLVILLTAVRAGRGASIFAAALSTAAYDFFFVPPYFTFDVEDLRHLLTFVMMFVVGVVISTLTLRIRRQAQSARAREQRTATLHALARELGTALDEREAARSLARHGARVFGGGAAVLLPGADGALAPAAVAGAALDGAQLAVARWTFEHGREAGIGTDTLPGARVRCVPLPGAAGPLGVLALVGTPLLGWRTDDRDFLDAFVRQGAVAVERARLGEQARAAALRARSEELRSSLLSAVSHDLRTPLAAITGAASALREEAPGAAGPERQELLDTILEEAERLERLVANLLDMTRLEAGRIELRREWVPLEEIVGAALGRLEPRLAGREVRIDLPADLPLVAADPLLLEQLVLNLVENAIKYTPASGPIEIAAMVRDGWLELSVADRGPGLPRGEESRVFEKFFRGRHPPGVPGVGLGLSICRGIAEAHGGTLRAEAREGGGARFRLELPLDESAPAAAPKGPVTAEEEGSGSSAAGPLILLVEDEVPLRRFLRAALVPRGFRLVEAETAAAAEIAATSHNPDLVLLDLGLPDEDGIALIHRLREWSQAPILVISARGREADKVEALDAGADDYLTKPFAVGELLARIRVALRHAARAGTGSPEPVLELGGLRIDTARRHVTVDERTVHLTPIEWKLLVLLARHAGRVLTHRQILREVWGPSPAHQSHTVRVHMAALRRKIEADPARPRRLVTEPSVGYRLREEPEVR